MQFSVHVGEGRCGGWRAVAALSMGLCLGLLHSQENRVANPGFELAGPEGFAVDWAQGEFGKLGKTVFLDQAEAHAGRHCLRLVGTPNTWTTCAGKRLAVSPEQDYWITWWFKARQPASSRTYLFLQTNTGQRVFPQTDRRGDFGWTLCIARYRTRPDETWLHPVLTMQTTLEEVGTSWWDEVLIADRLSPELEAAYRSEHPWDDPPPLPTACLLARTSEAVVWTDEPEARIYVDTPLPADAPTARALSLAAPGRGHDACQLVVAPSAPLAPLRLEVFLPPGLESAGAEALTVRVVRGVEVTETRDPAFRKGLTPDPLIEATEPEPVTPGRNVVFWLEWAPPAALAPGEYHGTVTVRSGDRELATVPVALKRWRCELPEVPHYRSMVLVTGTAIRRFYPALGDTQALELAWDLLARYRLSGFNLALFPTVQARDGQTVLDWSPFDQALAAAQRHHATALTIGPMFGGGCSEGWKPRFGLAGRMPLADPGFDALYIDLNRQIAERLRQAGLLDKAYVYPYDEPEPDYMDKVGRLCDLIHQGDPALKVLMTTDPATGRALWGKVNAWIVPWSSARPDIIGPRRQVGDEVWIYNLTAAIEDTPLAHRTFLWHALDIDARGGLLWNACWWNGINPWENPTAKPVPVGRQGEQLYRYAAGQASLFYPARDGKGPLVPALRLALIRQGVEDFDLLTSLVQAWQERLPAMPDRAAAEALLAQARKALIAPVVLDPLTSTASPARVEAMRHLLASELEVARQEPATLAFPARIQGRLVVAGCAAAGSRLTLNGEGITLRPDGSFQKDITPVVLAAGLNWTAEIAAKEPKTWTWPGWR